MITNRVEVRCRKGFTLLELILVLAIFGLLIAIAVPNFVAIQEMAKIKADITTCENIMEAARMQHLAEGFGRNDAIGNLSEVYLDARTVVGQSKYFKGSDTVSAEPNFYLMAFDRNPPGKDTPMVYGVLWMTEHTGSKYKGNVVIENEHRIIKTGAIQKNGSDPIKEIVLKLSTYSDSDLTYFGNDGPVHDVMFTTPDYEGSQSNSKARFIGEISTVRN
jgi:prepilin-type N-terminal cleavage/methylation domain-containing protein